MAAPAANLAFQPVKEEDVKSDKRAPLDVDLNNIDIRLQVALHAPRAIPEWL